MMVIREEDRVRLITRGGYNWSKRYPWIVESALKNRYKQFVIDGEAVVLGVDGSDFDALHSGKHNDEVQLYAFDILALNGDDLRPLPLSMRKAHLERLLERRPDGSAPSSKARSAPISSAQPATWALMAWSQNASTDLIAAVAQRTGLR